MNDEAEVITNAPPLWALREGITGAPSADLFCQQGCGHTTGLRITADEWRCAGCGGVLAHPTNDVPVFYPKNRRRL